MNTSKERFTLLRQLSYNARGDLELEARDALARIEQLEEEDRQWDKLSLVQMSREIERLRAVLRRIADDLRDAAETTVASK
jgi:hypothetical protein